MSGQMVTQDIMSGTSLSKSLCAGAGWAPGAEPFGRPTERPGPKVRAGARVDSPLYRAE